MSTKEWKTKKRGHILWNQCARIWAGIVHDRRHGRQAEKLEHVCVSRGLAQELLKAYGVWSPMTF